MNSPVRFLALPLLTALSAAAIVLSAENRALAEDTDLARLEQQFLNVPMEARRHTGPLFWMHGDESREQLEGELKNVLEGHNGASRPSPARTRTGSAKAGIATWTSAFSSPARTI